jgi:hypothetical protein
MKQILAAVAVAAFVLAWAAMAADKLTTIDKGSAFDAKGNRVIEIRPNPLGGFDVYDTRGRRIGSGRESPYGPGTIELYGPDGTRGIELPQDRKRK